jgi:protoporphyrinogen/coproporphyrinogen III oxidase
MRVVVVGGGVTGLSAAYELVHGTGLAEDDIEVVVLEAGDRFGGKIHTSPFAGRPVDEAADAFLARVPDAVDLCRQLGLGHQLVTPATRQAHLFSLGQLRPFPDGLVLGVPTDLDALAASGAVSPQGVARAGQDLTMGPDTGPTGAGQDESVGELVRRRVGDEVFERLVAPLLSGVHAGNADQLSVAAGAPAFAAALRGHDSLMAGLAAQRQAAADPDAPVFYGLASGTEGLIDALVDALRVAGAQLALGSAVSLIRPQGSWALSGGAGRISYEIHVSGQGAPIDADAVILTTPLDATARLLAPIQPDVAEQMTQVDYASVALVALAVPVEGIDRPLDGSGYLVAQPEGLLITACSWASSKWAHLADPATAVLRASVGRADDTRADDLSDPDLVEAVTADLATTMDLVGPPTATRVTRWPRALPQFTVGHLDRVKAWQAQLADEQPGLLVAGAGLSGLGIPACIGQGRAAARAVGAATVTPGAT